MLKRISSLAELKSTLSSQPDELLRDVAAIIGDVRESGDEALLRYGTTFGDIEPGESHIIEKEQMLQCLNALKPEERELLQNAAERIRTFAQAQRESLHECSIPIEGGTAGQRIAPLESAACYAPGGRYPLPSSVLMTVIPARVAGVERVWVLSPRPSIYTLAAAAIAGADRVLAIGGAQAIAAVTYGTSTIPRFDIVVGPGNKWVTAAKQLVYGTIAIDMLAGPSELIIVADDDANPALVAADLLAQAEHDPDARIGLIALSKELLRAVDIELEKQLDTLPTKQVACISISKGFAMSVASLQEGASICDEIAPEHLSLHLNESDRIVPLLKHFGALFIGSKSAEVFGDYGLGPNHVLPTGRASHYRGGLSVLDFLRVRTWMKLDQNPWATTSAIASFARMEGLEAHARSSEIRAM
jgi:phosphoribosyl-ATP pyrophosphohydrolase/phosphoribosyl-AMP cyclohydrolase/histidinol dehydrogenase